MVIGIIGTSKNTGKTTTLSYLLRHYYHHHISVGVTGIGYDGEETDNITFLPKPRLYLEAGTIATTSEKCLLSATAEYEILDRTGTFTALGEVIIVRVTNPGMLVIAGPNRLTTLTKVIELMCRYSIDTTFIDGSLNRIAPMSVADHVIFTTGGARNTDIRFLTAEMHAVELLFDLPLTTILPRTADTVILFSTNGEIVVPKTSLLDHADVQDLKVYLSPLISSIFVPALISLDALEELPKVCREVDVRNFELILTDPCKLLLSGEPIRTSAVIEEIIAGSHVSYLRKPLLSAITINPFYPDFQGQSYHTAYLDREQLFKSMKDTLPGTPVFNIKEPGNEKLFKLLQPNTD
jgi:molybdopterin-guanine dinucleotide biosynthesis protein